MDITFKRNQHNINQMNRLIRSDRGYNVTIEDLPKEIIEIILKYLNLDDFVKCVRIFPAWKTATQHNLVMTENSGVYFSDLLEIIHSCPEISLSLDRLGPTCPCGISSLLLKHVQAVPNCLSNLVYLNLSHQTQSIKHLIDLFSIHLNGSINNSPFPFLNFLSIRPTQNFPRLLQSEPEADLIIPPRLNELHLYLYGEIVNDFKLFTKLLKLATNVVTLSICEEFSINRKWALIFQEIAYTKLLFSQLRILRFMDEGGFQTELKNLSLTDRHLLFPKLEVVIADLSFWNHSPSKLPFRLNFFPDCKTLYTDRTVGTRTQQKLASRSSFLMHRLQIGHLNGFQSLYDSKLRSCTVFFNADGLTEMSQLSEKTPVEHELSSEEQVIEYLGISSRLADTTGQISSFAGHCRKLGLICRVKLIPLLQLCGKKLYFVAVNQQLLAACAQDDALQAILLANKGRFQSVKSLHILGTLTAANFAPGAKLWSSIRFLVALFPKLETLRMNYMYAIDPFDIETAISWCHHLTTLYIHRFSIETEACQKALLKILENMSLISLSLLISQPPTGVAVRSWTRAFRSSSLRYLHLELSAGGQVYLEEARSIVEQIPTLVWLIVQCNDSHVIDIYRPTPGAPLEEHEHLRLETLDLPVLYPQLFNILWFRKYLVSYCHFPNYSADHFARLWQHSA